MAEGNNKLTNILLGAAILGLGYAIYQTYPNEITVNAENIKDKIKGLFSKKKPILTVADSTTQPIDVIAETMQDENVSEIDIYLQQPTWNDLPKKIPTDVIVHYEIDNSMNQKAINRMTGNQPTRQ